MSEPETAACDARAADYDIRFASFDDLSRDELYDLLKLRFDVFVLEQESIYPEIDGEDKAALHLIATLGEESRPVGTLRITGMGAGDASIFVGRVAVARAHRGTGLGARMIAEAMNELREAAASRDVRLGAQLHLESFYQRFGFSRCSEIYDDGGIPHVKMVFGGYD